MCVLFITNSTRWTCTCHLRLQVRVTCQILSQGCVWLPASLQAVCKSFTHTSVFSWWLRVYQHPLGMKFFIFFKFIYLFMAALGFRCCMRAFSSCGERGLLFVAVHGLLIVVASLVAEHRLQMRGLQQLWHMGSVVMAHGLQCTGSVVVAHRLSCSVGQGIFLDRA